MKEFAHTHTRAQTRTQEHLFDALIHSRCDLPVSISILSLIDDIIVLFWFLFHVFPVRQLKQHTDCTSPIQPSTVDNVQTLHSHTYAYTHTHSLLNILNINNLIIDYDPKCKCIEITMNCLTRRHFQQTHVVYYTHPILYGSILSLSIGYRRFSCF